MQFFLDAAARRRRRREIGMARPLLPLDDAAVTAVVMKTNDKNNSNIQRRSRSATTALTSLTTPLTTETLTTTTISANTAKTCINNNTIDMPKTEKISLRLTTASPSKLPSPIKNQPIITPVANTITKPKTVPTLKPTEAVVDVLQKLNNEIKSIDLISKAPKPITSNKEFEEKFNKLILECDKKIESLTPIRDLTPQQQQQLQLQKQQQQTSTTMASTSTASNDSGLSATVLAPTSTTTTLVIDAPKVSHETPNEMLVALKDNISMPSTIISPVKLQRKSSVESSLSANPTSLAHPQNHIVSILKKKDPNESSSSSNSSPVTFSSSVVDTPTRTSARQGILKKRSSLDESRYSRSQSPDERGILVKNHRRNSLEEIQHSHGILKQSSYESVTIPSNTDIPHGILKKKETPTQLDHLKHVSIVEAVNIAAAELNNGFSSGNVGVGGTGNSSGSTPRPILKKKYSTDADEMIRPILKSSRKSSREESLASDCDGEGGIRPILKSHSPSRKYSQSEEEAIAHDKSMRRKRSKSLEISGVSVTERIRNMEQKLLNCGTVSKDFW